MAKEEKIETSEAPPKKSKKLLIIIVAVVLLVVLAGGAAAFFLLKKGGDAAAEGDEVAAETSKGKSKDRLPPVYIALDTFTVNLVPETGEQYLQVAISVEAEDPGMAEQIKIYTPRLRHEIMDILSSKKPSEVSTREGKKVLAEEIRKAINGIVELPAKDKKDAGEAVRAVLFTTFIIQ
ncbi:MAG TPA: flagellar basal body-associated FliL family protein [Azospira sp.]|nr:flagellar basal body-associated FliL family protein [Azospira sp.]